MSTKQPSIDAANWAVLADLHFVHCSRNDNKSAFRILEWILATWNGYTSCLFAIVHIRDTVLGTHQHTRGSVTATGHCNDIELVPETT